MSSSEPSARFFAPAPIYPTQPPALAPTVVSEAAFVGTGSPTPRPPRRTTTVRVLAIIGFSLLGILTLIVTVFLVASLGPIAFAIAGIMALVPLAIVLLGVNWIDRWEPEPRGILVFGFLWGAAFAVVVALVAGATFDLVIDAIGGLGGLYEFVSAAIQAPIVEEAGKGLGLLVIFLAGRKHFDGPVDGLVYAAWVGGGFAFTENILYFGSQLIDAQATTGDVVEIFVIRGFMSPFAHVMFTACTGLALGIAARRTGVLGAIGAFVIGLIPAVLLHALWNGALFFVNDFYGYYALVQLPLFVGALLLVRYLRKQEAKLTFERLTEYADAGWYAPGEVAALATFSGRRVAKAWAAQRGLGPVMKKYTRDSTRLAFTRDRLVSGRATAGAEADEAALLASIVATRAQLQGGQGNGAQSPA